MGKQIYNHRPGIAAGEPGPGGARAAGAEAPAARAVRVAADRVRCHPERVHQPGHQPCT